MEERCEYLHDITKVAHERLVTQATNVVKGPEGAIEFRSVIKRALIEPGWLMYRTGEHVVSDVFCAECDSKLGWYYARAEEDAQKYKEGT